MIWTKEQVVELIEMLKAASALWDIKCKEYRDRKYDEMSKKASHFKTNLDEISKKIKSLKTQFSRERKKIVENSKSGAGTMSEDNISFGYNMMRFLMENNISKGSRSTIEEDAVEEASHDFDGLSISSTDHGEEDETQLESDHSIANQSSTSQPIRPSSEASAPKKKPKRTTNTDARVDEAYKFMRSIQENVKSKDDFEVYGANVASRMRTANQNSRAIAIAKNRIDNILFDLQMRAFPVSDMEPHGPRSSFSQFSNHRRNDRHHPAIYYSSQASSTPSSSSIPLSASSPYPSPSSTPTESMHSIHMQQTQYQSTPQCQSQSFLNLLQSREEIPWIPHSLNNTPKTQQSQQPMSLPQDVNTPNSRSTLVMNELNEILVPNAKSQ